MNLVNCKCGANQNKIVFDCKNDPSEFGEYRRLTCMSCGQTVVRRGVVPGSDSHSLQDDWNTANSVTDAPKLVSEIETCATCRFWLEDYPSINEEGFTIHNDICRAHPKYECRYSEEWCGEWKGVKA